MNQYEYDFCLQYTKKLLDHPLTLIFRVPVDPKKDGVPDYLEKIDHPMDLSTILKKLENREYERTDYWKLDVDLIWTNAKLYHGQNLCGKMAVRLQEKCNKDLKNIPHDEVTQWRYRLTKANKHLRKILSIKNTGESIVPRLSELAIH